MQRPASPRPLAALLLAALAALVTVVSGPSAAAAGDGYRSDPAASVQGIAPNGDDATARNGSGITQSAAKAAADIPPRIEPLTPPWLIGTATESPRRTSPETTSTLRLGRAPPASSAR